MQMPEGWKHTTFNKHIDFLNGFAFKRNQYSVNPSDIKFLRGDNIVTISDITHFLSL